MRDHPDSVSGTFYGKPDRRMRVLRSDLAGEKGLVMTITTRDGQVVMRLLDVYLDATLTYEKKR